MSEKLFVSVRAELIPLLAPWTTPWGFFGNPSFEGVQIEPDGDGVTLLATNGFSALWIHDERGKATEPIVVSLDPDLVSACEQPARRTLFDVNNDAPLYPMPDWMRPGNLCVMEFVKPDQRLVIVGTKTDPPEGVKGHFVDGSAGLYHATVDVPFRKPLAGWRDRMKKADAVPTSEMRINPSLLAQLEDVGDYFGGAWTMTLLGDTGGLYLESEPFDGLVARARIMPMAKLDAA